MESSIELLITVPNSAPLLLLAPASLSDLYSKLSSSISKPISSISVLYNRKGNFFQIADNETYLSLLKKTAAQGLDEIEIKLEINESAENVTVEEAWDLMSNITNIVAEEEKKPEAFFEVQSEAVPEHNFNLFYRYLNGSNPESWVGLTLDSFEVLLIELSNIVLEKEGFNTSDWVCAFYTEDGNALTGTLAQLHFYKCNQLFATGSKLTVFIVPNFDLKFAEKLPPSNEAPNTITVQQLDNENVSYTFKIDLATATVLELKQIMFYFTNIPTFELRLKVVGSFLARDNKLLSEYEVVEGKKLFFERVEREIQTFTYKPYNKQSVAQSSEGIKILHSLMHSYSYTIEMSEKPVRESLLGYIRHFTQNCTPYVMSLYKVSLNHNSSILDSIAIEEGSILLVKNVFASVFKETVESTKYLEHVIEVFGLLCDLACNKTEELSREEVYKSFEITCPLTNAELKQPVLMRRTDAKEMYYEYDELVTKAKANEEVKFIGKVRESELKIDEGFKFAVLRSALNRYEDAYTWEGVYDTSKSIGQLVSEKHPQGVTLQKASDLKRAYKLTKPVPPLSLKSADYKNHMTFNKSKELVVSLGPSNKEPNKVDLMDIVTRNVSMVDIDDLASAIEMRSGGQVGQEVITRNPDEAIVVVFDISGSMNTNFFGDPDFKRIDATKEFFETFTDRNAGFDFSHVISLLLFQSNLKRACGFTENIVTFAAHIQNATAGGGTNLWDALNQAIDYLKEFKKSYPNAHLRILCLSDGEDTGSRVNYVHIAKSLVENNVTMDSICVGDLSQQLKAASFASGGYVFLPRTVPEGIRLFENEGFLSVRARTVPSRTLVNSEADLIPLLSKNFSNAQPGLAEAPSEIKAKSSSLADAVKKVNSNPQAVSSGPNAGALKRITKELNELNNDPHPSVSVYPNENDITFWNVFMNGPDTTPYEGGVFQLYFKFPNDYPFKPPQVKFLTPIYHCNINSAGSICHAMLKDQWSPAITSRKVFDALFGLLLTPEPLDPLDANIATEFRVDYELFVRNATQHTKKYASKSAEEIIKEIQAGTFALQQVVLPTPPPQAPVPAQKASVYPSSGQPNPNALKRISKELGEITANPNPSIVVHPEANNLSYWDAFIIGPAGSPYEGGVFRLEVRIPPDYPFKPPRVKFMTTIYHCNIDNLGNVCLNVLNDQWSPALSVNKVLCSILDLLSSPNPSDPLNDDIARIMNADYSLYFDNASQSTKIYASKTLEAHLQDIGAAPSPPPPQFLCGISGKIMTDPVMVVKSNNSYERAEIENVIDTTGVEPKTGEAITRADLVTNVALMCAIQEYHKLKSPNP